MNEVVEIIAARDGMSWIDAERNVMDVVHIFERMLAEHNLNLEEYEDVLRYELGLEPDYLPALLEEAGSI